MEKELILSNARTFEEAARDSLHEANTQTFKFCDLLIKIGFAVGGLVATRIVYNGSANDLIYSKCGLIFFAVSVIFGGIQIMIDRSFFRKNGYFLINAADRWKFYGSDPDNLKAANDARKTLDELASVSKCSSEIFIYLQMTFVVLGVIFSAIDVFLTR